MVNLRSNRKIQINASLYFALALVILVLPVQWALSWAIAVCIHEWFHFIAVRLCKGQVYRWQIGMSGMKMEADIPTDGREFICAIAGPVGSLLLLLLAKWFPRIAVCGLIHGVYNLLPVFPLDGGRALKCLVNKYLPKHLWIIHLFESSTLLLLLLLGLYCTVRFSLGIFPLILPITLWIKQEKIKIPCIEGKQRVQ